MARIVPVTPADNATRAVFATPVKSSSSQKSKPLVAAVVEASSPVIVAKVNKEVKGMAVGIGIRATNDIPFISSIHAGSLLATSALRIGMNIQSVNNLSMSGKTAREAANLRRDAVGEITIVAGWNLSVSSPFITAPIACPDEEDKNSFI